MLRRGTQFASTPVCSLDSPIISTIREEFQIGAVTTPTPQSHREDQMLTHWQGERAAAASEAARAGAQFPESHGREHHPHARLTPGTQAAAQLRPGVQSSYSGPDRDPRHERTCGNYQKKSLRPVAETQTQPPSSQESVSGPRVERPKRT